MVASEFERLTEDKNPSRWPEKENENTIGFFELFRYADRIDKLFICLGILSSMVNGMGYPVVGLIFGAAVNLFLNSGIRNDLIRFVPDFLNYINLTKSEVMKEPQLLKYRCQELYDFYNVTGYCNGIDFDEPMTEEIKKYVVYFIISGSVVLIAGMAQVTFWTITGERQANRIRHEFLKSVLRQDIGWFDTNDATKLNCRLMGGMAKIQAGLGEKAGYVVQCLTCFGGGYTIGFISAFKEAAVLVAVSPLLFTTGALFSYVTLEMSTKAHTTYAKAGSIAKEALSAIRTVIFFGGEDKEVARYESHLGATRKQGRDQGMANGLTLGLFNFVSYGCYALGLWYGSKLVRDGDYSIREVTTSYFCVSLGTVAFSVCMPAIQALLEARTAATAIYSLINLKSKIDSSSPRGKKPFDISGRVKFHNVHFNYPGRPNVKVLNGFSLDASPGQTVALVGASGCGKSTTMQLLLRFYDPVQGQITLDGVDLKDLNVKWLRNSIGLVSQEPVLFDTTIAENIRYGCEGASMTDVIEAAKIANAYSFISKLPNKFDTRVGERGTHLSGGQKQRIAIARALVNDPKILLLDEATSALDTESQSVVQDALDKARQGRTTLVIAHRLSTIRTADVIVGMDNGVLKETGTHDQLMTQKGIYWALVMNQAKEPENIPNGVEAVPNSTSPKTPKKPLVDTGAPDSQGYVRLSSEYDFDEEDQANYPEVGFWQLLRLNFPEWRYLVLGCIGAMMYGGCQPSFAGCYSAILETFTKPGEQQKDDVQKYSLILIGIGALAFIGSLLQGWMFAEAGEGLTIRLRKDAFKSMLRQEMEWFDRPNNNTGALTNRLANDTALVKGAIGLRMGVILECFVAITVGISIALSFGWKLTLVSLVFVPLLVLSGSMQIRLLKGNICTTKDALNEAGKVAVEAIENIRTVASLCKENYFEQIYEDKLKRILENLYKKATVLGFMYSFSQAATHFSLSAIFAYGAKLVEEDEMKVGEVFLVFCCICFSGIFLGQVWALSPDIGKAKAAARRVLYAINRKSEIDSKSPDGKRLVETFTTRDVKFQDVTFTYPSRPDVTVLHGLSFSVPQGQTVALVGRNGSGRSTCIGLLERLYSLQNGRLTIDDHDIHSLNIRWMRSQIGLVSQEPVLFDCSIAENIAYGDNSREVSMDEIISVAKQANIHNFICKLPLGYDTNVGEKGTHLSGGQKQRIAIARALIRNPKILLLDEATSSLDTDNQRTVQKALDKARVGRTCITIANRLSTIRDADKIVVIDAGRVVEEGTHDQLMQLKGFYYKLQHAQSKQ